MRSTSAIWGLRFLLVLITAGVPACGGGGGTAGHPNGILWLSPSGSGSSSGGPTPTGHALWVDPNSGLGGGGIGPGQLINSTDDASYAKFNNTNLPPPFNHFVSYIFALEHPLSTDTTSSPITQRESALEGLINAYRQAHSGWQLNPPQAVGPHLLPSHFRAKKAARAHGKHAAYFHPGALPGEPYGGRNAEGDRLLTTDTGTPADTLGTPAPGNPSGRRGRLGKVGVTASSAFFEFSYSGATCGEVEDVFAQMLQDDPNALLGTTWTHVAVGHWRGGTQAFYWNILFLTNPNPAF